MLRTGGGNHYGRNSALLVRIRRARQRAHAVLRTGESGHEAKDMFS